MSKHTEAMKLALEAQIHKAGMNPVMQGECYLMHPEALQKLIEVAIREARADQPAQQEPVAWVPYLSDRADGVSGHYAIARWNPRGYREVWNLRRHAWGAYSDDVLSLEEADTLLRLIEIPTRKVETPQPAQPQQEPVAQWQKKHAARTDGKWENANEHDAKWWRDNAQGWEIRALYTSPPPQRTWVDPNDKTQKQYLPHIGEPVLFCHKGMTYMGKHTGGSFQSEVTNQYFNTWECHWMYLPAAHDIQDKQ